MGARSSFSKAVLVLHEPGPRGGDRVAAVSPAAARLGVRAGMALADAVARWGNELRLKEADPRGDREELTALARQLDRFSPIVGLEQAERPESIFLDITGLDGLFGGEKNLATLVRQDAAKRGLQGRLAVADTLGAAWAVSHFCDETVRSAVRIPSGGQAAFLAPLPLNALRLSATTLALLDEFGLRTAGDVLALPRASLASRLGGELLRRLDQALGTLPEPIAAIGASQEFAASWELEHPTDRRDAAEAILQHLCSALAEELSSRGLGACELACTLSCERDANVPFVVGLFEPAGSASHFYELLQLRMERIKLPARLCGVRLEASRVAPAVPRQRELFANRLRAHEHEYVRLVNRLAGRLGRKAVIQPVLRADPQPELAWREQPVLDGETAHRRRPARQAQPSFGCLERPLFLLRPPVAVEAVAAVPDGPPARLICQGKAYRVADFAGPERIETGWWRKRGVRRDYYRVETDSGARFWLFRSLRSGRWYLQGEF